MRRALWKTQRDSRRNVALVGFMGAGKSTVARRLAALAGMTLDDIDERIEEKAHATIAEIFRMRGEDEFRRMEQAEIEELGVDVGRVAACGGGAVTNRSNVRVLRNNCLSVWLWADVKTALGRIGEIATRPLLGCGSDPEQALTLLARRLPYYARTSDLLINTAGKEPEEIAERIWDEFSGTLSG